MGAESVVAKEDEWVWTFSTICASQRVTSTKDVGPFSYKCGNDKRVEVVGLGEEVKSREWR